MSASFRRIANVTASTKRPPAMDSQGQRGDPEPHLSEVKVTPLDPAETQVARDLAFRLQQENNRVYTLLQSFTELSNDVLEGDVLVVAGREYPVRMVGVWTWRKSEYLHLVLEEPKP